MSTFLHNLISIAMGLFVLAAPAMCMCTETARQELEQAQAHVCCAEQQSQQQDQGTTHGESCTHCGAQKVQPVLEHSVMPLDMLPVAALPMVLELKPFYPATAPVVLSIGQTANPVETHTCSLT